MADRRTDASPDVARTLDRFSGQRHHALCQRLTVNHGALHRKGSAHVLHQNADIGRAATVRNLFTGQNTGQLLGAAGGILGRDHADLQIGFFPQRRPQCGNRLRLIVLNTDQHPFSLKDPRQNAAADQNLVGAVLHQPVVGGNIGFTLRRVDNQRINPVQATFQFGCGREARTAQPGNAGLVHARNQIAALKLTVVADRLPLNPAIFAVRLNEYTEFRQCRRVGGHMRRNFGYRTGRWRVNGQHPPGAKRQRLAAQYAVAGPHADLTLAADMLL